MFSWLIATVGIALLFATFIIGRSLFRAQRMRAFPLITPLLALFLPVCALAIMQVLWSAGLLGRDITTLFFINTVLYAIIAYFLTSLFLQLRQSAYLSALRWLYLAGVLLCFASPGLAVQCVALLSASLIFLAALNLVRRARDHLFLIGISCALFALFLMASTIALMLSGTLALAYFLAPLFFVIGMLAVHDHLRCCDYAMTVEKEPSTAPLTFVRTLLFVCVLVVFTFMLTLGVHEAGHAVVAQAMGCSQARIIFTLHDYPFTETNCALASTAAIYWAGLAATSIVGALLLLLRQPIVHAIGRLMLGLGLFFAYDDLVQLHQPPAVFALVFLGALALMLWGVVRLSVVSYASGRGSSRERFSCSVCSLNA